MLSVVVRELAFPVLGLCFYFHDLSVDSNSNTSLV